MRLVGCYEGVVLDGVAVEWQGITGEGYFHILPIYDLLLTIVKLNV